MSTDLFVAVAGMSAAAVMGAIPPACRSRPDAPRVTIEGDVAVLEAPAWTVRPGVRHLVPSCSLLRAGPCSFRFELSALTGGTWTPWATTATVGPPAFTEAAVSSATTCAAPSATGALVPDVDQFTARQPIERVRLRVRMRPAGALPAAWTVVLSASDPTPSPDDGPGPRVPGLAVPALSQMAEAPEIGERVCSPTCVAMVLGFWGRPVPVREVAAEVFHEGLDRYGVWPAAIHAAARRGVAGYLLRFPDWASAAWCLARGLPVIASIRFEAGELQGAPIARTGGHLVVITGAEGDEVLVNDPAGPSRGQVPRRYLREEFCRAWIGRSGVGYVLFPP
jgi:hypothetical protein